MPLPHYIDVDLKQTTYLNEPLVTQNDDVTFIVRVSDDGQEFIDLNTYSTFTMASVRPDKQPVLTNSTSVNGNEITFLLGSTEISVPGRVEAAIQLYDVNGRISSFPFSFMVIKDKSVGYIPSEKEQTLIELVLGQGPAILNEAKRVAVETIEAESLRVVAESNRVNAESQRVTAESDRDTNENDRVTNEIARVEAETLRNEAEDIRIHAEEERQTNTANAIQNAENATEDAANATEAINLVLPNVLNLEYIAPYNNTTQYLKNNIVRKDKNSYIALQPTLGNEPNGTTDSPFWGVLAIGGVDGLGSVISVNGVSPDANGNVTLDIATSWNTLKDKPTSFPPSAHTHTIENVTGLQSALDSKANKIQETWKTTVLQNGWSGSLFFRKNEASLLEVIFSLSAGQVGGLTRIATLPTEYRPRYTSIMNALHNNSGALVQGSLFINASGEIILTNASTFITAHDYVGSLVTPMGG